MDEILRWGMLGLMGAMVAAGLVSLYLRPGGDAWRCPGVAQGWRMLRPSRHWFIRGRCWHRLDGLEADRNMTVRCPECGTQVTRKRRLQDGYRFRFGSLAVVFLLLGLASGITAGVRGGAWSRSLPGLPLVMLAQADFITHRSTMRRDLATRNEAGTLSDISKSILAWRLVREFRDDDRSWNALKAQDQMNSVGKAGIEALRWEFLNGDEQSKSISMRYLRAFDRDPPRRFIEIGRREIVSGDEHSRGRFMHYLGTFEQDPSQHLIDLWIQSCAHETYTHFSGTIQYLRKHLLKTRPKMIQTMKTGTGPQKFVMAIAFAELADAEAMPLVVDILTAHLEDNDIRNDRGHAMRYLSELGPRALPLLKQSMETLDLQGRFSLGRIRNSIQRYDDSTWEHWYRLPAEKKATHRWGPWEFLRAIKDAPPYVLDQLKLETNDASR